MSFKLIISDFPIATRRSPSINYRDVKRGRIVYFDVQITIIVVLLLLNVFEINRKSSSCTACEPSFFYKI